MKYMILASAFLSGSCLTLAICCALDGSLVICSAFALGFFGWAAAWSLGVNLQKAVDILEKYSSRQ